MIVRAAPTEHFQWLSSRCSCVISDDFRAIEAVDAAGRIHGMLGYSAWTPNSVTISIALEHPSAFRHLRYPAFEYPFLEAGREIVLAYILDTNSRSVRLTERLGFQLVTRIRDGWTRGTDILMYEMRKENCRWLRQGSLR